MPTTDKRCDLILDWLNNTLKLTVFSLDLASDDASFRRYFRVIHSKGQHIVMDAPPDKENIEPFIRIATLFKNNDVNVPTIFQQNHEQGFLLLEDFGNICFQHQLDEKTALDLYLSAFNSLYTLQQNISENTQLPHYDETLLNRELDIFYDWFLKQTHDLLIPESIKNNLNHFLITSALEQPKVCVHRDFHSRNLMVLNTNSPGVIDFQDAVIGPVTYDLVSLLRDCYIDWPEDEVEKWMMIYFKQATKLNLINVNHDTFSRWFDLMGLQRHLKAIGIFSRLHLRDNKSSYLADIPRTMNYVKFICNKYPELNEFNQYLTEVNPASSEQLA